MVRLEAGQEDRWQVSPLLPGRPVPQGGTDMGWRRAAPGIPEAPVRTEEESTVARKSVLEMDAAKVYGALVQKAEKKGKTRAQVDEIACWLTGYTPDSLAAALERGIDYGTLFREAPEMNPGRRAVTGVICGVRVEEIEDPLMHDMRCLDKMVDELTKGKAMEKILRSGSEPVSVDEYISQQPEAVRPMLEQVRGAIRTAVPDAKEIMSWGMPTYWKDRNLIHFAAQKKHIGLYPGEEAVRHFADRLTDFEVSRGTVRFPLNRPLPLELIGEIAAWCRDNTAG